MILNNWVNNSQLSLRDKIIDLLKISNHLVLIQQQELELLKNDKDRTNKNAHYINYLYNNYIIEKLPRTYLQKHIN